MEPSDSVPFCLPTEISNFLSVEECEHIIKLAKEEGMETSQTLKEGIKQDTRALGKNTKEYFDMWDQNQDGQIDMDEVKIVNRCLKKYRSLI